MCGTRPSKATQLFKTILYNVRVSYMHAVRHVVNEIDGHNYTR